MAFFDTSGESSGGSTLGFPSIDTSGGGDFSNLLTGGFPGAQGAPMQGALQSLFNPNMFGLGSPLMPPNPNQSFGGQGNIQTAQTPATQAQQQQQQQQAMQPPQNMLQALANILTGRQSLSDFGFGGPPRGPAWITPTQTPNAAGQAGQQGTQSGGEAPIPIAGVPQFPLGVPLPQPRPAGIDQPGGATATGQWTAPTALGGASGSWDPSVAPSGVTPGPGRAGLPGAQSGSEASIPIAGTGQFPAGVPMPRARPAEADQPAGGTTAPAARGAPSPPPADPSAPHVHSAAWCRGMWQMPATVREGVVGIVCNSRIPSPARCGRLWLDQFSAVWQGRECSAKRTRGDAPELGV